MCYLWCISFSLSTKPCHSTLRRFKDAGGPMSNVKRLNYNQKNAMILLYLNIVDSINNKKNRKL